MARQKGILEITGTMGNITFYKSQDGMLVKEKSAVSKDKIMNSSAFERTRENMQEFGNAGKSAKLLADAVRTFMLSASDNRVSSRLAQTMRNVLKQDLLSPRGQRNVAAGIKTAAGKELLNHFNFNKNSLLGSVLYRPYTLDTATGEISISQLIPSDHIAGPKGASHVSMSCAFATVDFNTGKSSTEYSDAVQLPLDTNPANIQLTPHAVPAATPDTIACYFIKMEFYQEVNGVKYTLNNNGFNCLELIDVL
jgi:hypothetical protein